MGLKTTPEEKQELLVTYAALILNDDGAPINADNINALIKAAGASVEPYWPKLFASLLEGQNVTQLLLAAGGGGGGGSNNASSGGGGEAKSEKKEEAKKEEEPKEEEEEADMGFSLFD